jgi:hypothetical protein
MFLSNPHSSDLIFWSQEALESQTLNNGNKKISTLTWSIDSKNIIDQINWLKSNQIELILSEILPDEVPENLLLEEYFYFEKNFLFLPPSNNLKNTPIKNVKDQIILIVDSLSEFLNEFELENPIISNILLTNPALNFIEIQKDYSMEILDPFIQCSENLVFHSKDPIINHYCEIIRSKNNLQTYYLNQTKAGSMFRYLATGLDFTNKVYFEKNSSVRSFFSYILQVGKSKHEIYQVIDKKLFSYVFETKNSQEIHHKSADQYNFLTKKLYQHKPKSETWRFSSNYPRIEELGDETLNLTRYQKKAFFSLLNLENIDSKEFIDNNQLNGRIEEILSNDLNFRKGSWVFNKYLSECLINHPHLVSTLVNSLIRKCKTKKNVSDSIGYLGELILFINHISSDFSDEHKNMFNNAALACFEYCKVSDSKFYQSHHDFITQMKSDINVNSEDINRYFTDKTKPLNRKSLSRILPLFINLDKNSLHLIEGIRIDVDEFCKGLWYSHGYIHWDLIYEHEVLNNDKKILNQLYDLLTHFTPDKENFSMDMIMLSVFLNQDLDFSPKSLPPIERLGVAQLFKLCGRDKHAFDWINSIDVKDDDLSMILLLIYYKKVIGLDEDSRQLAIKIDKTVLENKIGSDEEWMFNFSGLISLFFKIKGIENLSDKFYRISESFNVGHHLIDFSFRK